MYRRLNVRPQSVSGIRHAFSGNLISPPFDGCELGNGTAQEKEDAFYRRPVTLRKVVLRSGSRVHSGDLSFERPWSRRTTIIDGRVNRSSSQESPDARGAPSRVEVEHRDRRLCAPRTSPRSSLFNTRVNPSPFLSLARSRPLASPFRPSPAPPP